MIREWNVSGVTLFLKLTSLLSCARSSNTVRLWDETTGARRLLSRFLGHCNMETDIKEAVFLGQTDDLVACGSDEGKVFIYEAVRMLLIYSTF